MINKKGFTLIEVLLIILLIGMFSVIAISSTVGSSGTFEFLSNFKSVMTTVKTARSYAVNNVQTDGLQTDRYGAEINFDDSGSSPEITLTLFADTGNTPLEFDAADATVAGYPKTINGYTLESEDGYNFPLTFFYETISTDVTVTDNNNDIIEPYSDRFITLKFTDNKDLERYILIMQVSGLVEEYADDPIQ